MSSTPLGSTVAATRRIAIAALIWSAGCLSSDTTAILPGAPRIITQPSPRTVLEGDPVALSVTAGGDSLAYQWFHDGAKVIDATTSTLSIAAAQQADAGLYFVVIGNHVGALVSDTARLVVNVPPTVVGFTLSSGSASSTNTAYGSTTADQSAVWVSGSGSLTLVNPTVTKSGDASSVTASLRTGINAGVLASGGTIVIIDGTLSTSSSGSSGVFASGAGTHVSMTRGSVTTTGASSFAAGASQGATLELVHTRLRAASSTVLSATDGGIVSVVAEGDSLSGQVTADATSTLAISLTKGSRLSGAVQLGSVTLDSTSTWNVTAPSALQSFSDPLLVVGQTVTNVIGNGIAVTYDATRPENAALGGRTYALTGGGSLAPR